MLLLGVLGLFKMADGELGYRLVNFAMSLHQVSKVVVVRSKYRAAKSLVVCANKRFYFFHC